MEGNSHLHHSKVDTFTSVPLSWFSHLCSNMWELLIWFQKVKALNLVPKGGSLNLVPKYGSLNLVPKGESS